MSNLSRGLQGKFVPYPVSKGYFLQQKLWLRKNPWVSIGQNVIFPLQTKVLGTPLEIRDGTVINGPMTIKGSGNVSLGKYCGVAENLFVISSNHEVDRADVAGKFSSGLDISKGPTFIGNNVWLGDNVTLLSGVTIGDGAVVGAGSVVTKDIPAFGIAVGVPAKTIKFRFASSVMKQLLNLGWWYWNDETLKRNKWFFEESVTEKNMNKLIKKLDLSKEKHVEEIRMNNSVDSNYLLDGWGAKEEARWVQKESAALVLKVTKPKKYTKLQFEGFSFHKPQLIEIKINNKSLGKIKIGSKLKKYELPVKNLKFGANFIQVLCVKGLRPSDVDPTSQDRRKLYCCFSYFKLK